MSKNPEDLGKEIITEVVKDLSKEAYKDVLKPTAKSTGKLLGMIPEAINAALLPINQWIAERNYKLDETKKLLSIKLANVNPDKIVAPEAYIAVPALQAISYSMDSDELRNMYASLLASAMTQDSKDMVHPSFVEIIKQLSPFDSILFKQIDNSKANPIIDIWLKNKANEGSPLVENFYLFQDVDEVSLEKISTSLCNLDRMNLIEIIRNKGYKNKEFYDKILSHPVYLAILKKREDELVEQKIEGFSISPEFGALNVTPFGNQFEFICID
jgi:hypothetical protein